MEFNKIYRDFVSRLTFYILYVLMYIDDGKVILNLEDLSRNIHIKVLDILERKKEKIVQRCKINNIKSLEALLNTIQIDDIYKEEILTKERFNCNSNNIFNRNPHFLDQLEEYFNCMEYEIRRNSTEFNSKLFRINDMVENIRNVQRVFTYKNNNNVIDMIDQIKSTKYNDLVMYLFENKNYNVREYIKDLDLFLETLLKDNKNYKSQYECWDKVNPQIFEILKLEISIFLSKVLNMCRKSDKKPDTADTTDTLRIKDECKLLECIKKTVDIVERAVVKTIEEVDDDDYGDYFAVVELKIIR